MKEELKNIAFEAKQMYKAGLISRREAQEKIRPYIEYFNEFSKATARKYGLKPKLISFAGFVR